jgi:hypothetical protein
MVEIHQLGVFWLRLAVEQVVVGQVRVPWDILVEVVVVERTLQMVLLELLDREMLEVVVTSLPGLPPMEVVQVVVQVILLQRIVIGIEHLVEWAYHAQFPAVQLCMQEVVVRQAGMMMKLL